MVNPATGDYTAFVRSPTGLPADPALTAHGVDQARELAAHLERLPAHGSGGSGSLLAPVERIYCSPFYRCLQTVQPFAEAATPPREVRCDAGLVDWFGPAPFEQPQPAALSLLRSKFFPWITESRSGVVAPPYGESMAQLHARMAAAMAHIVRQADAEGVRAVLVCSHAAPIIAVGRALTGALPADVEAEDFGTFTCGLSVFRRRRRAGGRAGGRGAEQQEQQEQHHVPAWDDQFQTLAGQAWTGGRGVGGGWDCVVNCDCSFLSAGEERGW